MLDLNNKRVLVVGLGKSGIAASRLLLQKGARVIATDNRPLDALPEEVREFSSLGITVEAGGHSPDTFLSQDLIILSPGVPAEIKPLAAAREQGIRIIGELELAYQHMDIPVIAITGSNGKSTTTTLVGEMLKEKGDHIFMGGNLGTPLSEYILGGRVSDCAVVEVSSFQLETIDTFRPCISILLNISPDHLDRYRDNESYAEAKFRIFENQQKGDSAVINADESWSSTISGRIRGNVAAFSRKKEVRNGICLHDDWIVSTIDSKCGKICRISEVGIRGVHNLENAMAASAAAILWGCSSETIAAALRKFSGLEHRLEFVREIEGVKYINDSKGTNVGAVIRSLESFTEPVLLIAGGRDKGSDFSPLRPMIKDRVKRLILIGEASEKIGKAAGDLTKTFFAKSLEEAVWIARQESAGGDVVLLSPACASFDMFKNFEDRGRSFKEIVWKLRPTL